MLHIHAIFCNADSATLKAVRDSEKAMCGNLWWYIRNTDSESKFDLEEVSMFYEILTSEECFHSGKTLPLEFVIDIGFSNWTITSEDFGKIVNLIVYDCPELKHQDVKFGIGLRKFPNSGFTFHKIIKKRLFLIQSD